MSELQELKYILLSCSVFVSIFMCFLGCLQYIVNKNTLKLNLLKQRIEVYKRIEIFVEDFNINYTKYTSLYKSLGEIYIEEIDSLSRYLSTLTPKNEAIKINDKQKHDFQYYEFYFKDKINNKIEEADKIHRLIIDVNSELIHSAEVANVMMYFNHYAKDKDEPKETISLQDRIQLKGEYDKYFNEFENKHKIYIESLSELILDIKKDIFECSRMTNTSISKKYKDWR